MASTSRLLLKEDVLNILNPARDPVLQRFQMPNTTTALGTATTLVDATLVRGSLQASSFDGCQVEVAATVGAGPTVDTAGALSGVVNAGLAAGGILTVSPAFSAAVQNATAYLIYGPKLSPEIMVGLMNDALINTECQRLYAPSLVNDSDFDANDATLWPVVGTPTQTFVTTYSGAGPILVGERAQRIQTTVITHGFETQTIYVEPFEVLLLSVIVEVASGGVVVHLWDKTNNVSINSATVTQQAPTEVRFQWPATSSGANTVTAVSVRFVSSVAVSDFLVQAPVILQSASGRAYTLPSWFVTPSQAREAFYVPIGFFSNRVNYTYSAWSRPSRAAEMPTFLESDRSINPLLMELWNRAGIVGRSVAPVVLEVRRAFDALNTNAATTQCDREYLMWKTCANIETDPRASAGYNRLAMARAKQVGYGKRELRLSENARVVV